MDTRLEEIFEIISFYDDYRWESYRNYNLINFFKEDLDADIKILTHWLCYIADRQTPFQRVWDIGGFVFSELTYEIKKQKSLNLLNPEYRNTFIQKESNDDKYTFISSSTADNNRILPQYINIYKNDRVKFKSRFLPSDYFSILYTFVILKDYNFSFSRFIKETYSTHKDESDYIKRVLFSLYLLTYHDVGQPKSGDLGNFNNNLRTANKRKKRINKILSKPNLFDKEYSIFTKDRSFKQKRAWCSLRDFLKSPVFKQYFETALNAEGLSNTDLRKLFSYSALTQLELPGDVWNNNSKFRKCILKDTDYENSKMTLNKILRDFFDNNKNIIGYPEQFDITFDFVPRMCDLNNCHICPINGINNKNTDFYKICLKDKKFYCPVVLVGCNYKNNCKGKDNCKINHPI